jgi:hypothetical protein
MVEVVAIEMIMAVCSLECHQPMVPSGGYTLAMAMMVIVLRFGVTVLAQVLLGTGIVSSAHIH